MVEVAAEVSSCRVPQSKQATDVMRCRFHNWPKRRSNEVGSAGSLGRSLGRSLGCSLGLAFDSGVAGVALAGALLANSFGVGPGRLTTRAIFGRPASPPPATGRTSAAGGFISKCFPH